MLLPPLYAICDLFASFQGEGFWCGQPMVFVRFWGCPFTCSWCDEPLHKNPQKKQFFSCATLYEKINQLAPSHYPILLTGGEPLAAPSLQYFIDFLKNNGRKIAVETSGQGGPWPDHVDWITLSPKKKLSQAIYQQANEIKYIIDRHTSKRQVENILQQSHLHPNVFVQPVAREGQMDIKAMENAMAIVIQSQGTVQLSLQLHKVTGIP